MDRSSLVAPASALLFLFGCTSSSSGPTISCDSTVQTGPCTGSFTCGAAENQVTCLAASQVCVVEDGTVGCMDVSGASAQACPSAAAGAALAACTPASSATCTGSSSEGITVNCPN